jgi:putative copper resistance protein D
MAMLWAMGGQVLARPGAHEAQSHDPGGTSGRPADGAGERRRSVARLPGLALLLAFVLVLSATAAAVVVLLAGGGRPVPAPAGLPDAGALTAWALRVSEPLVRLLAALTVGTLVTGAVLLRPCGGRGPAGDLTARVVRAAGGWASAWAAGSLLVAFLTVSVTTGLPPHALLGSGVPGAAVTDEARAALLTAAVAAVVALLVRRPRTVRHGVPLLGLSLAATVPAAAAGHAVTAVDPAVMTSGLLVHVVAAAIWIGGLAAVVLHLRSDPAALALAMPRFSALALVAFAAVGVSGVLTAAARLGTGPDPWVGGYGGALALKAGLLAALGALGYAHRRRTMPALVGGRPRALLRVAAVELVLMAAATGAASALARTPAPVATPQASGNHGAGHDTLPATVAPLSMTELFTAWRVDAVVLAVLVAAAGAYVAGVRRVAARGDGWPRGRTVAFASGLVLALLSLCSGAATYAPALVSVQVAQLLVLLLAVPLLLLLGRPLTLWQLVRGRPLPGAARPLCAPFTGAAVVVVLLVGLYRTPLIELSLRSYTVHLVVLAAALGAGILLLWPVLGADPVPQPRSRAERAFCLVVVAGVLVTLAAQLVLGDRLLAGAWFLELRWGWVDPVADQRLAGLLIAGTAVGVLLLAAACLRETRPAERPEAR